MKNLKFVFGFICGAIIFGSLSVFANGEEFIAKFSKYNFLINGEIVEMQSDPIVYQDTTYLPVRSISNQLGYDVTYKADSKTIVLDNQFESQLQTLNTLTEEYGTALSEDNTIIYEWMSLKHLSEWYDELIVITTDTNVSIKLDENEITFPINVERTNGKIHHLQHNNVFVYYKFHNNVLYINDDNLIDIGLSEMNDKQLIDSDNSSVVNGEIVDPIEADEWMTFSELSELYSLSVEAGFNGVDISNGSISLHIPPYDLKLENQIIIIETNLGEIQIKNNENKSVLNIDDLKRFGIISS